MTNILFLSDVSHQDIDKVGLKAGNVATLFKRGYLVPPGFIISAGVFNRFFSNKYGKAILTNKDNPDKIVELQREFRNQDFPDDIADEIIEAYLCLAVDTEKVTAQSLLQDKEVFVAVRGSYLDEVGDVAVLSQKTILNVKGKERLFKAILECYASTLTPGAVKYRIENSLRFETAILVQKMVNSEKSGVAYSFNPTNINEIIINAVFGLGEGLIQGNVYPDTYVIDKKSLTLKEISISDKQYEYVLDFDDTAKHVLGKKGQKQVLSDNETIEIARLTKKIETEFQAPQKVEWAIKGDKIFILQTKGLRKPETVEVEVYEEEKPPEMIDINELEEDLKVLETIETYERQQQDEQSMPEPSAEEKIEDGSFLGTFREFTDEPKPNKLKEFAFMNAGNVVFYSYQIIFDHLKSKLSKYHQDIPKDFNILVDNLLEFENLSNADEYRRIFRIKEEFIKQGKYPAPEDVELALRLLHNL